MWDNVYLVVQLAVIFNLIENILLEALLRKLSGVSVMFQSETVTGYHSLLPQIPKRMVKWHF